MSTRRLYSTTFNDSAENPTIVTRELRVFLHINFFLLFLALVGGCIAGTFTLSTCMTVFYCFGTRGRANQGRLVIILEKGPKKAASERRSAL